MAAHIELDSPVATQLQDDIGAKLIEYGYGSAEDNILAEYITAMVVNNKTHSEINSELVDLIGEDFDSGFTEWLMLHLHQVQSHVAVAPLHVEQQQDSTPLSAAVPQTDSPRVDSPASSRVAHPLLDRPLSDRSAPRVKSTRLLDSAASQAARDASSRRGPYSTTYRDSRGILGRLGGQGSPYSDTESPRRNTSGYHTKQRGSGGSGIGMTTAGLGQRRGDSAEPTFTVNIGADQSADLITVAAARAKSQQLAFTDQDAARLLLTGQPLPKPSSLGPDSVGNARHTDGTVGRVQSRCRYWPNCISGEGCAYIHPTELCRAFPDCPNPPDECHFIHPATVKVIPGVSITSSAMATTPCKFGAACTNVRCGFKHPPERQVPSSSGAGMNGGLSAVPQCRYYPNCTNPICPFTHGNTSVGIGEALSTNEDAEMGAGEGGAASCKKIPVACKNGAACKRPGCYYMHPQDKPLSMEAIACKFGVYCTRGDCAYFHPFRNKQLVLNPVAGKDAAHVSERQFSVAGAALEQIRAGEDVAAGGGQEDSYAIKDQIQEDVEMTDA